MTKAKLCAYEDDQARIDITEVECEFTLESVVSAYGELRAELDDESDDAQYANYFGVSVDLEVENGNDSYCEGIYSSDATNEFNEICDKIRIAKDVRDAFGPNSVVVISNDLYIGVGIYRFYVVYKENEKVVYLNDQTPYNRMCGMHGKYSKNVKHEEIVPYLANLINKG